MIAPTVGRKVWYRPSKFDLAGRGAMAVSGNQPLDATVLCVWGDRMVNVLVTDIMGKQFPLTSIKLLQPEDSIPVDAGGVAIGGYVEWMPFQQGQAKVGPAVAQAGEGA